MNTFAEQKRQSCSRGWTVFDVVNKKVADRQSQRTLLCPGISRPRLDGGSSRQLHFKHRLRH